MWMYEDEDDDDDDAPCIFMFLLLYFYCNGYSSMFNVHAQCFMFMLMCYVVSVMLRTLCSLCSLPHVCVRVRAALLIDLNV